jgi:hypothetical protein
VRGHRLDVVFDGKVGHKAAVFGRPGRVYIYSRYASMQDGQLVSGRALIRRVRANAHNFRDWRADGAVGTRTGESGLTPGIWGCLGLLFGF